MANKPNKPSNPSATDPKAGKSPDPKAGKSPDQKDGKSPDPNGVPTTDPAANPPAPPPNLPPDNFKELSILQLAYALQKYPKKEPSPEWERVRKYAQEVHSMYFNRFNLNKHDSDLLLHLFSNYFNGIVNVWIKNDESITKRAFVEHLQLIIKICIQLRRLRICNKSITRHTVPPGDINKCTTLKTIVFESCNINELDILKYTNVSAIHLLYCQITGDILNGHFKKIRLIKCKCNDQNKLAQIISSRVVTTDESTNELKEIDFQEALQVANELPTKDVLLYRLDSTDEFILEMKEFVAQNGPFIGHVIKPVLGSLQTPTTVQPVAGKGQPVLSPSQITLQKPKTPPSSRTAVLTPSQIALQKPKPKAPSPSKTAFTASKTSVTSQQLGPSLLQEPPQLLQGTEDFLTYKPLNL